MRRGQAGILIASFALAFLTGTAAHAENPAAGSVTHEGGLACFSVQPPELTKDRATHQSCNQICAVKHAACVGLELNGAFNPAIGCGTTNESGYGGTIAECRCCAVAR